MSLLSVVRKEPTHTSPRTCSGSPGSQHSACSICKSCTGCCDSPSSPEWALSVATNQSWGPLLSPKQEPEEPNGEQVLSPGQHPQVLTASITSLIFPSGAKFQKRNKKVDRESKITQMCTCRLKATSLKERMFNEAVKNNK